MAERAIAELGGESDLVVRGPLPRVREPERAGSAPEASPAISRPSHARGDKVATRKAYGDALTALGARDPRVVALDGEVSNSTYADEFAKAHPGPLLRDVHRRATDGGLGGRPERPWLQTVCLDLRGVPHPRPRLHPHGRDLARERPSRRLARRRRDRRRRSVPDGARGSRDDARGARLARSSTRATRSAPPRLST